MGDYRTILGLVLPVYGVIVVGALARRGRLLAPEAETSLTRLIINVLFPCLVVEKILGNAALRDPRNVLLPPVLGFVSILLGYALAAGVGRLLRQRDVVRRTFAFTVGTYNYGYVPLPLALALFGDATVGVLFVFNVGVEVALWTVGLVTLTGGAGKVGVRTLVSVPLVTIVAGVVLNAVNARPYIPDALLMLCAMLGQCAIPLALLLIGAVAHDHTGQGGDEGRVTVPVAATLLRLGLLPAAFLAAASVLPLSPELGQVVILQAAMPAAMFPVVMTRHYGGDVGTALRVVITTSVLSLATAPWWIEQGLDLLRTRR